jgi:DNA (cytosine-5)-methyltransferase 1
MYRHGGTDGVASPPTRILSLFTGIGGLDLGYRLAFPGIRTVVYVEREAFCCEILARRIEEGLLDEAPIWAGDVAEFPADQFRGRVDAVAAGFPCPPVSNAGKKLGTKDPRWLWPQVLRVLRATEARWVLLENVEGLRTAESGRAYRDVLAGLAGLGFDAEWITLGADAVAAPHRRSRMFILGRRDVADAGDDQPLGGEVGPPTRQRGTEPAPSESGEPVHKRGEPLLAHPRHGVVQGLQSAIRWATGADAPGASGEMDDSDHPGLEGRITAPRFIRPHQLIAGETGPPLWPPSPPDMAAWASVISQWPDLAPAVESTVRGVAVGTPGRVDGTSRNDRLRALGNAVVPLQAAAAFRQLFARLVE